MSGIRLQAPSRLHFGLLAYDPAARRQFGGVGLMIAEPSLELSARPGANWTAEGPLAHRVLAFAERVAVHLKREGCEVAPIDFRIHRAPPEHVGLGIGTQLGLAVARLMAELAGRTETPVGTLAEWVGRGLRSGIGLHGAALGGLIVDGGRRETQGLPPLLSQVPFPDVWSILLVIPRRAAGLHGEDEVQAFGRLPPIPASVTDRLCRLVLLELLPAVIERDFAGFGEALTEIQEHVGRAFAPAQGGMFGHPDSSAILDFLRSEGLRGVGQSSWGPTLYGFTDFAAPERTLLQTHVQARLGPDVFVGWTAASPRGVIWERWD